MSSPEPLGITYGPNENRPWSKSANLSHGLEEEMLAARSAPWPSEMPQPQASWASESSMASLASTRLRSTAFALTVRAQSALADTVRKHILSNRTATLPTEQARHAFTTMLSALVRDGGPTPQPGLTSDGGIETQWLVNGQLVSAVSCADGSTELYGVAPDGTVLFSMEQESVSPDADGVFAAARDLLAEMGQAITSRVPTTR